MGRPPCCDKTNVKRGLWTPEEDAKILAYVSNYGIGNWTLVPKKAEEELIINLHAAIGSRWSLIAKRLPGRTDNDVKNYWNTKLRKKLMNMGIDPVTHKPVSQVLSDLGSINGLPSTGNLMNNMLPTRTEPSPADYSLVTANAGIKTNPMVDQVHEEQAQFWENQVQYQPNVVVFSETASSSSSSSSSNLTQLSSPQQSYTFQNSQITPPSSASFDWSDFLHGDSFVWSEMQQSDLQRAMSSAAACEASGAVACGASHSNSGDSFVEGILDRDSEIRAAFPDLLDDAFDY
ncbi:hypothetical protein PIB30_044485 [Stylosanthes scabra]|uniref:Uncharacterized protein n=1 Tax=Stylosanthes scabra TaxID=79078 RepID=A0ABU6WFK0_9FABA|nr:hypothetical protein [Stylosanthes scabra]